MEINRPTTEISTFDEKGIYVRGKSLVDDLIGEVTFTEMIYLQIMGQMPTKGQTKILDACLVTLVEHGILAAVGARMVYMGSPDFIQGAVAAGIMSMGNQFGGVMENVGEILEEIIASPDGMDQAATDVVARITSEGKLIPGMGHPHHRPDDPRSPKLFAVAEAQKVPGKHIAAMRALAAATDAAKGRHVTINATAAIAACLGEIGIPWRIMRGFAVISRAPGIVGHIVEEQQNPAAYYIGMTSQEQIPYTGKPHTTSG